jgi:RNA polymerase sigma-70 factor (ECF subfamily)
VRSDSDLLAAWQGGDAAAGEELVSRHWASISRFFRAKVGDGPASADLIAQVFLACVEGKDRIAGEDVKPYLFAVARRRLAEHFRERAREPLVDVGSMSLVDLGTGVETAVDRREREALLRAALARIPLDDQIALELAYLECLPLRDVARVLDLHENTIRSRLARAKDRLRHTLLALGATPHEAQLAESALDPPPPLRG